MRALISELNELVKDLNGVDLSIINDELSFLHKLNDDTSMYAHLVNTCQDNVFVHPDWGLLAGRVRIYQLKQSVPSSFSKSTQKLHLILKEDYYNFVMDNADQLNKMIVEERDWQFDSFAVETLVNNYLARTKEDGKLTMLETPQYMWLRVATFMWYPNMERIKQTYDRLSEKDYIHASPTLFNSGLKHHQLSSCFVAGTKVFTCNGPIAIERIQLGELVMTHNRRWKEVVQLHKNLLNGRKIYEIEVEDSRMSPIQVTGNHRLRVFNGTEEIWVPVDDIEEDTLLVRPELNISQKHVRVTSKKLLDISPEYVYTLGVKDDHSYCVEGAIAENCFLLSIEDNMESIGKSWLDCALISKNSGGIGMAFSSLRHSEIGNYGDSSGIVPWARILNVILKSVNQCFDPSTIVYTKRGPITIQEVLAGDKMIRSDGHPVKVRQPVHYPPGEEMYEIQLLGNRRTTVSKNHPLLVVRSSNLTEDLAKHRVAPVYTDVKNLDTSCYVVFPIPVYEKDIPLYSPEDCYLCGLLTEEIGYGDGKYSTYIDQIDQSIVDFIQNYLSSRHISYTSEDGCLTFDTSELLPFTEHMLVDNCNSTFVNLPLEKAMKYVEGLLDSAYDIESKFYDYKRRSIEYVLLRAGIWAVWSDNYLLVPKNTFENRKIERVKYVETDYISQNNTLYIPITSVKQVNEKPQFMVDLVMERTDEDYETTANYLTCVGQAHNGGRRPGSGAVYLEPWHLDIYEFLDLRKATGAEDMRARDLFYALWVPDEFMRRVEKDEEWTLLCPNKAKGLDRLWGLDFEMTYNSFEQKVRSGRLPGKIIRARDLWCHIIMTQIETGMPYMLYKDACNRKSNQRNMGTIRCSNLCAEIIEYTDEENISSCILSNIALNNCVRSDGTYDFDKLEHLAGEMVRNLNQVIDRNYYPKQIPAIKNSNFKTRPLGIGVQGFADTLYLMDLCVDDPNVEKLNHDIFETIYYGAVKTSIELAKEEGPYELFDGSPASQGFFQFDLWDREANEKQITDATPLDKNTLNPDFVNHDGRYDWSSLRQEMMRYGMRNSLLIALMPTASSSHILGNTECIEIPTKMMYARTTLSGQFVISNRHMVKDLQNIGMWKTSVVRNIIEHKGTLQEIPIDLCPEEHIERFRYLQKKYRTAFETSQKVLLKLSVDRGRFVCQTQSFNCWMPNPTFNKLNNYHFTGWRNGIKTGMYYLRQPARADPINFSLNTIKIPTRSVECTDEICVSCQ